jgi:hypothetical protein
MATYACSRESFKYPDCTALVTLLARHGGMGAEEGKAILVNLSLLRDGSPARHGVTLCAIGAHFPLMNVGVTVLAILAHLGEHRFGMASRAFHLFVHSVQRVVGRIVVKLEDVPNRTPGLC